MFESVCKSLIVESQVLRNFIYKESIAINFQNFPESIWRIYNVWLMHSTPTVMTAVPGVIVWNASRTCLLVSHACCHSTHVPQCVLTIQCNKAAMSTRKLKLPKLVSSCTCWTTKTNRYVYFQPGVAGAYVICLVMRSRSVTAWVSCFLSADFGSVTAEIKSCT